MQWIRPDDSNDHALWGIKGGVVVGLWPTSIINIEGEGSGGPRGLLRIGYEAKGRIYRMNFIAVEPVVDGKMEFSEISPSKVDGTWGKLIWASDEDDPGSYYPAANTRGKITQPDPANPEVEELSFFVFMEQYKNGVHPYLKVSIRSDRPEEIGFQIFNHESSAKMDRCVLTATMGNYARLRKLHLKDEVVDSRELYKGYDDIHFIEKESYPIETLATNAQGDLIAVAETNESFAELASWPQNSDYYQRIIWRYRPFFTTVQYWRKDAEKAHKSLRVRVNGRATYWAVGSNDRSDYVDIFGGPAFENFEMREDYYPGQEFFSGSPVNPWMRS